MPGALGFLADNDRGAIRLSLGPLFSMFLVMKALFMIAGGIGLFLLGMMLLTDGLKTAAGNALKRALVRFTGSPVKAFFSGAVITALVQSSSATTVTVIGFVSAGLLSFPQAVGVVIGASVGTTATGWLVSGLGLKISVGYYALPMVGIGAFIRLLGRGRIKACGLALAGFGLIFVGLGYLQDGMRDFSGLFDLSRLPTHGLGGHAAVMLVGVLLTLIMQSSSAAVATTLTALHAGAVTFDQAASLVIGAAIGTTVTGALAAIGGTVQAKRTALAHVTFNTATGLLAIGLLPMLLKFIGWAQAHAGLQPGAMSLAAFHTTFIGLGAAVVLPFAHSYARLIERLLPDRGPKLTAYLDDTILHVPSVALEATHRSLLAIAGETVAALHNLLGKRNLVEAAAHRERLEEAVKEVEIFLTRIPPVSQDGSLSQTRLAQLHAVDHLLRLLPRLAPPDAVMPLLTHEKLRLGVAVVEKELGLAAAGLRGEGADGWLQAVGGAADKLAEWRRTDRADILRRAALGEYSSTQAVEILDACRWLDRLGYHVWRLCHYLTAEGMSLPPEAGEPPRG